ncbi:MAG: hypothetical protein H0X38_13715, partial [Planctomycetes bacterium]|nr:hypothetical protein [Planctomycetota bacterium]
AKATLPAPGPATAGLGELSWTPGGIRSSIYGTLAFMTPIAELDLARASKAEADAYQRFRDSYQRNWRAYFDPIAARFVSSGHGLGLDLSVLPLIAASDYQQFIEVVGKAAVAAGAGDPHQGAVMNWVMAIDKDSARVQEIGTMASGIVPGLKIDLLGWLGQSLAVYADADPVWAELLQHQDDETRWVEKNFQRLPVAVQVEVSNPLKLTLFLTAVHGFVEQSAPGLSVWENRTWHEHPYVRVGMSKQGREQAGPDAANMGLCFAATPRALILTMDEALLQRALDRQDKAAQAPADKSPAAPWPWLGTSMDQHVDQEGMTLLRSFSRRLQEQTGLVRRQSWSNLPILNVWHRLFPGEDPVAVHERLWGVRLICPAGGTYAWNALDLTMESTACGHPGAPKATGTAADFLADIASANFGLTFADHGLRARVELERAAPAAGAAKP